MNHYVKFLASKTDREMSFDAARKVCRADCSPHVNIQSLSSVYRYGFREKPNSTPARYCRIFGALCSRTNSTLLYFRV